MINPETKLLPSSLYIHVPFCKQRCSYCSFFSGPADETLISAYVKALCTEIRNLPRRARLSTLFFGGGTPSLLSGAQVARIMEAVRSVYQLEADCECSLEANPESLSEAKLASYMDAGINRLSIGVQSSNDARLKRLGRLHRFDQAEAAVEMARRLGIKKLSLDLIFGLPGQSLKAFKAELESFLSLGPDHLSFYGLQLEAQTPLGKALLEDPSPLPKEEAERAMYHHARARLLEAGLEPYELSNAARPGFEARHNLVYWEGRSYDAVGPAAASYVGGVRRHNVAHLGKWMEAVGSGPYGAALVDEVISHEEAMREHMLLGLRLDRGVSSLDFKARFGFEMLGFFASEIQELKGRGLIEMRGDVLALTALGRDLANLVFEAFLA